MAQYMSDTFPGVALYISGEASQTCPDCDGAGGYWRGTDIFARDELPTECPRCDGTGEVTDDTWCYVTMVGDDTKHLVERDSLTEIPEDAYCSVCGQIGCEADGR